MDGTVNWPMAEVIGKWESSTLTPNWDYAINVLEYKFDRMLNEVDCWNHQASSSFWFAFYIDNVDI